MRPMSRAIPRRCRCAGVRVKWAWYAPTNASCESIVRSFRFDGRPQASEDWAAPFQAGYPVAVSLPCACNDSPTLLGLFGGSGTRLPDKPKIGGSTFTVTSGEVRAYDDSPAVSLADPLAWFDPPEPPDLSYVDAPPIEPSHEPVVRPLMTLEEEIEAAIDFEEPEVPRTVDRVVERA